MHAEILAIGDEITSGQSLDTNSQWLSQRLEELGVRTLYHTTVGDELQPSIDVFRQAIDRSDIVIATGGLGPTADDLTREALARATDRQLLLDADALEYIRAMFASRRRPMPKQNELQAFFPAGSRVVVNPHGTAPGIDLEITRPGRSTCRFFCLPGVPAEMVEMWHGTVAAAVAAMAAEGPRRVIRRRLIHCFGAGESQIESMLPDMIRRGRQPTVGITASKATITLRIIAEGESPEQCEAMMGPTVEEIHRCLGPLVFGEGDDELQHAVVRLLAEHGQTLATAERGTAGLLAEWLGGVDTTGEVYRGGLVTLRSEMPVDRLALACREQFGVDIALAVGPFPEADASSDPPATVDLALATADGVRCKAVPFSMHPALSKIYCGKQALDLVRRFLADGANPPTVRSGP